MLLKLFFIFVYYVFILIFYWVLLLLILLKFDLLVVYGVLHLLVLWLKVDKLVRLGSDNIPHLLHLLFLLFHLSLLPCLDFLTFNFNFLLQVIQFLKCKCQFNILITFYFQFILYIGIFSIKLSNYFIHLF